MSLINLANTLRLQLPETGEGYISLNETSLNTAGGTNTADVLNNLKNYLGLVEASLQVSKLTRSDIVDPTAGNPLVISRGEVEFLNIKMGVKELKFELIDATLSLVLQTNNFPEKWTLGQSFMSLGIFSMLNGHLKNPAFIFSSISTPQWSVTDAIQVALDLGLNFFTELDVTSVPTLELVLEFLSFLGVTRPENPYLFGQIDITKPIQGAYLEFPFTKLESPVFGSSNVTYKIFGFLSVKTPRLGMSILEFELEDLDNPDQNVKDATPSFYFNLPILLNDIELNFSATLTKKAKSLIFGVTNPGEHALTPGTLFQLMAGEDFLQKIPPPLLAALSSIKFYGFSMNVYMEAKSTSNSPASFGVSSIYASVGSTTPIGAFGPFEDFEFLVNWSILNPTDKKNMQSLFSFLAKVDMNGVGTFNIEITQA